ncbi:MAG: tetratricopeptide repeat protein [Acidimicrobiia bacterium]|nr:tetratricopeptide repeat protein [Acidimicrobiia bacterium]
MAKVFQLRSSRPQKFGYKKARRHSRSDGADSQLNIFEQPETAAARIVSLETNLHPFERALLYDERGNVIRATEGYQESISHGEYVADAYCNLGILESEQGCVDEAIECFKNSLKHDPALFETHYNLANVYFDLGDYRPAQVHYEIGASIEPGYANLYFNLALTLAMQDDFERAVEALESYQQLSSSPDEDKTEKLLTTLRRSIGRS